MSCACGKAAFGPCGCCEGVEATTPESTYNRPGRSALSFRIGTHASFLDTMVAGLPHDHVAVREPSDATIGLLDAWATVADVLTFYQERIANEGFLRTATENLSVTELGRLIGYQPRPGVAASAYLAFNFEDGYEGEVPAGTRVQSMPDPGELPQTFETSEPIHARATWNLLRPRTQSPQLTWTEPQKDLYVEGADFAVRLNDLVVIEVGDAAQGHAFYRLVTAIARETEQGRTRLTLRPWRVPAASGAAIGDCLVGWGPPPPPPNGDISVKTVTIGGPPPPTPFMSVVTRLRAVPPAAAIPPSHPTQRKQVLDSGFAGAAAPATAIVAQMVPHVTEEVYRAWAASPLDASPLRVHIFRVRAATFAAAAPPLKEGDHDLAVDEADERVFLDSEYPDILPGSPVALQLPGRHLRRVTAQSVDVIQRPAYQLSRRVTALTLSDKWWKADGEGACGDITPLRELVVYTQAEPVGLAEAPLRSSIGGLEIELDGLYEGLDGGRWLIVRGEPDDLPGIELEELVMLAGSRHEQPRSEDGKKQFEGPHTVLVLANQLARRYRRESVVIFGNVAHATHGESRSEVLGSGDAAVSLQRFTLRDKPLTYVSAPTPTGIESSLEVRVDGVHWPAAPGLAALSPLDRRVLIERDEDGTTHVVGGTGHRGARFATGSENLEAAYRKGIGAAGNVGAERLKNLMTRPLGVKDVINPMRASGGADPDGRDQARARTPLVTFALDRLVSVSDYAHFALNFGGIGKAASSMVSGPGGELIKVVIAAVDDAPLDVTSDVYRNLLAAYERFGEAALAVRLLIRRAVFLYMHAKVRLESGYEWTRVEPRLRAALLDAFGFERRDLGRPLYLSQVVAAMHRVRGIACVDVDGFGAIREPETGFLTPDEVADQVGEDLSEGLIEVADPDELAFFTPAVPETLILTEMRP